MVLKFGWIGMHDCNTWLHVLSFLCSLLIVYGAKMMLQMRQCEVCPRSSQRGQSKLPSTDGQSVACCFDDIYELKATSDMGCSIVSMCKCYKNCILIVCFVETASLYCVDRWLCILWKLHPCTVWIVCLSYEKWNLHTLWMVHFWVCGNIIFVLCE